MPAMNPGCIELCLMKKTKKKTKHNILPFLLLDSPLENANILKLFALFLIIACSPCQTTYLILSCVCVQAEVCMCYIESVVGRSPLWQLRWQSPNDKAKELPWKCCYYYLWSAGVSTFSFYQAISHRLALQWILFRIIICFTDTGQRYASFFFLCGSLSKRSPVPWALPTSDATCSYFQTKKVWNSALRRV